MSQQEIDLFMQQVYVRSAQFADLDTARACFRALRDQAVMTSHRDLGVTASMMGADAEHLVPVVTAQSFDPLPKELEVKIDLLIEEFGGTIITLDEYALSALVVRRLQQYLSGQAKPDPRDPGMWRYEGSPKAIITPDGNTVELPEWLRQKLDLS